MAAEKKASARKRASKKPAGAKKAGSKRTATPPRRASARPPRRPSQKGLDPFGRLIHYEITGLFGQYRHEFDLETEEPTILTGANGTGKSTILRSINAIGSASWPRLYELPFKSLTLRFDHAPLFRVTRVKDSLKFEHGGEDWRWSPHRPPHSRHIGWWGKPGEPQEQGEFVLFPEPEPETEEARRRLMRWERERAAQLEHYLLANPPFEEKKPTWIESISDLFPVRFVTEQRLVLYGDERRAPGTRERGEEVQDAVAEYAQELRRFIRMTLARYASVSQREDRAFPQLVVEATAEGQTPDLAELHNLITKVSERRAELQRVGLLEAEAPDTPGFEIRSYLDQPDVSPVIKTFAEVTLRKFDILEPFRRRLQLFSDFLADHFVDKRPVTSAEDGLVFELNDGSIVEPSGLSSGEQQMLVLAYQLLFGTRPGTLLLIDEPEISLHVGWQTSFVDDIAAMARDRGLQVLLASHSPLLIGGREELKRSLDKPAQG